MPGRPLLILDLDETLWSGLETPGGPVFRLRPGLGEFLRAAQQDYDLAVWSSATRPWIDAGLGRVHAETGFDLSAQAFFIWDRARCTWRRTETGEYEWHKQARKLRASWISARYPRERILAADDTPGKWASGYGHLVRVSEWTGDPHDTELPLLARYLHAIAAAPSLTAPEKRGWRSGLTGLTSP